jgi:hypothetical protein
MAQTGTTRSRAALRPAFGLLLAVLVLAACDATNSLAPQTPIVPNPTIDRVEVTPGEAELSTVPPGNSFVLRTVAWNAAGARVSTAGSVVTYTSSAPATATVNSTGVVTGLVPGTAVITVEVTVGGATRTATASVTVLGPGSWPAVGGVYDLTGVITGSDPAWGIEDGTTQVAVLTIQHTGDGPSFTGTFSDFRAISPSGTYEANLGGSVSGVVHSDGRIVMGLTFDGSQSSYWDGEGTVTAQGMTGQYGAGGHISGTFTANRR